MPPTANLLEQISPPLRNLKVRDRVELAERPDLDEATLSQLCQDPSVRVRRAVAYRPQPFSPDIWKQFRVDLDTMKVLVQRPDCPTDLMQRWSDNPQITPLILQRKHIPAEVQYHIYLFRGTDLPTLWDLAGRHDAPDDLLIELARNRSDWRLSTIVAENRHASAEVLQAILRLPDGASTRNAKEAAVKHPNLPEHIRVLYAVGGE